MKIASVLKKGRKSREKKGKEKVGGREGKKRLEEERERKGWGKRGKEKKELKKRVGS